MCRKIKRITRRKNTWKHSEKQRKIFEDKTGISLNSHKFHKKSSMICGKSHCSMCGNPRKFFGEKTLHEKKHDLWRIDSDDFYYEELENDYYEYYNHDEL